MGIETVELNGSGAVERRGLGARGLDLIERTTQGGTTTGFPLYDAHGNDVATLTRSGTSWSIGDERSYDACGRVRGGAQTGAPSARYCASLGHVQDDESGLVYMRARYYEPGTGRFVSEDPAMDGGNWFSYCGGDPVNRVDSTGKFWWFFVGMAVVGALAGIGAYCLYQLGAGKPINVGDLVAKGLIGAVAGLMAAGIAAVAAVGGLSAAAAGGILLNTISVGVFMAGVGALFGALSKRINELMKPSGVGLVVAAAAGYQFVLMMEMYEADNS